MKQYPKTYEDIYLLHADDSRVGHITSTFGSPEALANRFREFYHTAHRQLFDQVVKEVWLEQHFMYGENRRTKRAGNSYAEDWAFGHFMRVQVGILQKPVTTSFMFTAISSYLNELFPDFLSHDPFKEPHYFEYPFEHVTLDQMVFVYQVDNRMEMLRYSDEQRLSYAQFVNWATNWVMSYNEELDTDVYVINSYVYMWPFIRNNSNKKGWNKKKFNFKDKDLERTTEGLKRIPALALPVKLDKL